jgi:hypothetical protein
MTDEGGGFRLGRGVAYASAPLWPRSTGFAQLRCDRCDATWTGPPGEFCSWCVDRTFAQIAAITVVWLYCVLCEEVWQGPERMTCIDCGDGPGTHAAFLAAMAKRRRRKRSA